METSIFIARIFAVVYMLIGLGMLSRPKHYHSFYKEFIKREGIVAYLAGILATVAGVVLVNVHNVWEWSWTVVITVIGWMAILKGAFYLVWPTAIPLLKPLFKKDEHMPYWGLFVFVLGVFFGYFGFIA